MPIVLVLLPPDAVAQLNVISAPETADADNTWFVTGAVVGQVYLISLA